jgi:hypothetical protein
VKRPRGRSQVASARVPDDGPGIDDALAAALHEVAARCPEEALTGREALRDAVARRLRAGLGWRRIVIEGDRAALPGWPEHVEAVDVGVRGRFSGRTAAVVQVGWWPAGVDAQEALWEALRAAGVVRAGALAGYVVGAAPAAVWAAEAPPPFAAGERAVAPLLGEGAGGRVIVPSRIGSAPVAEADVGGAGGAWTLRAVRVWPAGGDLEAPAP